MIRISELKRAILESERLDRLGMYEESAAALAPVVRVAEQRMTKEAQWWRPIYKAGGQALEWLGNSAVGRAIPGIGKDIRGLGSMGHWGKSVVNDAEVLGRGRTPLFQRALPKGLNLSPEQMNELDEIMRSQSTKSPGAFNYALSRSRSGLQTAIPAGAGGPRGSLLSTVPQEIRGLFASGRDLSGRPLSSSQQAVLKDLVNSHRNADHIRYTLSLKKAFDEKLIDGATMKQLGTSFVNDLQVSPTVGNIAKGVGVGYAGAALTGVGHEVAAPPPKPSLFPTPYPNGYGPPTVQNPSMYPSGRPSSVGQPPPQIYW
jgi:hypothetical protein